MFNLVAVGDPLFEAVTVDEIKAQARVSHHADDAYIGLLAVAAREQAEKDLNQSLVAQQYNFHLEQRFWQFPTPLLFPYPYNYNYRDGHFYYPHTHLPIQPVCSFGGITYTDVNAAPQTLDPTAYVVKLFKDPPEIQFSTGATLPGILAGSDVVFNFIAGYGTGADFSGNGVPQMMKQAITILAATWYNYREGSSEALVRPVPLSYERIINLLNAKKIH